MSPSLSGSLFTDFFVLAFVLVLPIPTTPFLIYLAVNYSIGEFATVYIAASTLYITTVYFIGMLCGSLDVDIFFGKRVRLAKLLRVRELIVWRDKAFHFAIQKLKEISVWNIIVVRMFGIHATIVAFGSGMIGGKYTANITANCILAVMDVVFYWLLIGSGKLVLDTLFPQIDMSLYLNDYFFKVITISLAIFYVVFLLNKFIAFKKAKNSEMV